MMKEKREDATNGINGTGGKKHLSFRLFHLLSCLLLAVTVSGQSGRKVTPPASAEPPVVRIETREVILPLNAYDADGRNATDLDPKDILVIEDGSPRPVTDLRREPASIVLVLDLSNEIGTFKNGPSERRLANEDAPAPTDRNAPIWTRKYDLVPRPAPREFADNFVSDLASGDEIAIIQYSDRVQLIQDWTGARQDALTALQSKYRIGLKSRYYDALGLAAEKLRDRTGRKVIVLLTDGVDTASRLREREALAGIQRTGAAIFIVGWKEVLTSEINFAIDWIGRRERQGTSTYKRLAELRRFLSQIDGASYSLQQLAVESGGEWVAPEDFNALTTGAPRSLHREIGAQYSLAFLTERGPGLEPERRVDVLPARKGLTVRARRRYYIGDAVRP